MKALRHAVCALVAAASLLSSPSYATSFTTDQSDLWFNLDQSGEGVQLVQRGSVIFATLFVYGPGGMPTWYTATMDYTDNYTWTGALYATTGTYFGNPWNPGAYTIAPVGTMTWSAQTVTTGTLTWNVNGVPGTLVALVRQSLVLDNYSGTYAGYAHRELTGCNNPALNGISEDPISLKITQNGSAITTVNTTLTTGNSCVFSGTVSELGQMGEFDGSFACADGSTGTGSSIEVQVTMWGLSAHRLDSYSTPAGCQNDGWIGLARVTTF